MVPVVSRLGAEKGHDERSHLGLWMQQERVSRLATAQFDVGDLVGAQVRVGLNVHHRHLGASTGECRKGGVVARGGRGGTCRRQENQEGIWQYLQNGTARSSD